MPKPSEQLDRIKKLYFKLYSKTRCDSDVEKLEIQEIRDLIEIIISILDSHYEQIRKLKEKK